MDAATSSTNVARETATPPVPIAALSRRKRAIPAKLGEGDQIGAWRIDRELGRGGMGTVYAVSHVGFGKRAALKLCHKAVLGPSFTPATFLREARIVHLVDHPGVCDVFATGTFDQRPFLAMERLAGETLGELARRQPPTKLEALEILLELCDVLDAAHAVNVVHRDLKLDNVFVLEAPGAGGRRIKLLDWGVAAILGQDDPMRGMIAGTITYVAPEQVRGDALSPATDVYSLAVLAYQLLLGEPPFTAPTDLDLIHKHLRAPPPEPALIWPEIAPALARTLVAMLAKEPGDRPPMADVRQVFGAARDALLPRRSWLARLRSGSPGERSRVVGATLGVVCLIASLASMFSV
ncbi:MAG: serine/threonine-protein kinase [Kofleriaceae bacterium]